MKNITEILNELNQLPEEFKTACGEEKWCRAAMVYEKAVIVSGFIQMDDEARDRLLNRFDQELVLKAYKAAGWYKEETNAEYHGDRKKAV